MAAIWLPGRCRRCLTGSLYVEPDFDTAYAVSVCLSCGDRAPVARLRMRPALPELPAWSVKAG